MALDTRNRRDGVVSETVEALTAQVRVVGALLLRETRTRFGHSKVGYLWAILEPLAHIFVLSVVYAAFMRQTPIRVSMPLFFVTGFMPFFLFRNTSSRLNGAITGNKALLHLALVKNVDVFLARALLELVTLLVVLSLLMFAFWVMGDLDIDLVNVPRAALALLLIWMIGLGVGMINGVLNTLIKAWDNVYAIVSRPLYLLSGIFFMVDRLPPQIRDVLLWNPLLHAIEFFRSAIFPGYGQYSLNVSYVACWAIGSLVLGLMFEKVLRRRLSAVVA